ncbi:MAG: hypothetical protein KDC83_04240 [Flavobacteriales bacterium]|nr:hypothetical protein [Flavobacteriales bacterium]
MTRALLLILTIALMFSCKKKEDENPTPTPAVTVPNPPPSLMVEQGANDESARSEYDKSIGDVMSAIESYGFGSRAGVILPCGIVSVDTTAGKYKVNYGANCGRKKLSGTVTATIIPDSAKWKDAGTILRLDYSDYTVLFEVNNQTLVFNGSVFITNTNGGLIVHALTLKKTIVHTIRGELNIKFDNASTRKWKIYKKRTYSSSSGTAADLTGMISADSGSIAEVGLNKLGQEFITTIPKTFVYKNCNTSGSWVGPYVLTEGELIYTTGKISLKAEAGYIYSSSDNKLTAVNNCESLGYKLTWNINGTTQEQYQSY